jgi:ABC-2 type transport system permease protein
MLIRWLKIARAEMVRDYKMALRYPVELSTGLVIMYVLFMALYLGAMSLAGGKSLGGGLDGMVVGYCMWFFAMMAMNTMSMDIEREAQQGTLEQVVLHVPDFLGVLWLRAATHLTLGAGLVIVLNLAIQVSTGSYLHLSLVGWLAAIAVVIITLAGLCGVGLLLGGMSLLFKRIGQLSAIVQFSLFFLASMDIQKLPLPWPGIVMHLPMAGGVSLLKQLVTGASPAELGAAFAWLALDSACYALVGSVVFKVMERATRRAGLLSHY